MSAILGLLGLSFQGAGIVARVKAALAWAAVSAIAIGSAYAYGVWTGYDWRGAVEIARDAEARARVEEQDRAARAAEEAAQRAEAEAAAKREGERDATESDLLAPTGDDGRSTGLDADWLRQLERLR